jgi:hypothetical protein
VEFTPPADNYQNSSHPRFAALAVFAPADTLQACHGTSTVSVTQNSGYAPVIYVSPNGAGRRASFMARTAGLYLIQATNTMVTGPYTFRVVDTTLLNVRWNTMSGNDVQWIVMNVSDMPLSGIMTVIDMNGVVLVSVPVSIPPSGRISRNSGGSDLQLPREIAGSVLFSHNGPPNSVIAEAFLLTGIGPLPEKFDAISPR